MIRELLNKNHICMFLDFDGVINTFLKEGTEREKNAYKDPDSFDFCDVNCIDMLNQFCEGKHMDIVISSTWRFSGLSFCRKYLRQHGFHYFHMVKDTTEINWSHTREEEIQRYLKLHPQYTKWIILDDIPISCYENYQVQTDPFVGFDETGREKAEQILLNQSQVQY